MPMPGLVIAAALAAQTTDYRALAAVKPSTVVTHVRACGFRHVRVASDRLLQEDVVRVSAPSATQAQLRCTVRASLASVYYVQFAGSLDRRYRRIYFAMQRERSHADAIAWLNTRGLLGKLPPYDPTRSASPTTVKAIEAVCGPGSVRILEPSGSIVTFKPEALGPGSLEDETWTCVLNAAEATGYPLGFIGNERRGK